MTLSARAEEATAAAAVAAADRHVDHLDGWRGLAILALLAGHFFPVPGLALDTVGVNLFFVLSGLLMGRLLFRRREPLARFYRRRVARILPALLVFVAVVTAVRAALGLPFSSRELLAALFFVNNYVPPEGGPGTAVMPLGHIWSLSVEEHGYIVLSLVALAARRGLVRAAAGVGALLALSAACAGAYAALAPPKLAFDQWLHTEVAAYGLLATAWWAARGEPMPARLLATRVAPLLATRVAPLLAPALLLAGTLLHWWSVPIAVKQLVGVGCLAASIVLLAARRGVFANLLAWAPLRRLGLWSYSIYLWQQPFYLWAWRHDDPLPAPLALGLAIACGLASYHLVERPARTWLNAHWGAAPGGR